MKKLISIAAAFMVLFVTANAQTGSSFVDPVSKDTAKIVPLTTYTVEWHSYRVPPVVVTPPLIIPTQTPGSAITGGQYPVGIIQPGGKASAPIKLKGVNGKVIALGLTIDCGGKPVNGIDLTNCNDDTVMLTRIINTTAYGVHLSNCKRLVFKFNYVANVNFGLRADQSTVVVDYNQWLNLKGQNPLYDNNFAHFIQLYQCDGGGQSISYNRMLNQDGIAANVHDLISVDNSHGLKGDSIKIWNNIGWGGQKQTILDGGSGGGIMPTDEAGSFQSVRRNVLVRCGCAGIQSNNTNKNDICSDITIDHNWIYNDLAVPVAADGVVLLGTHKNTYIGSNRVYWLNKNNHVGDTYPGGETGYWLGGAMTMAGVTFASNNTWYDTRLWTDIAALGISDKTLITYK